MRWKRVAAGVYESDDGSHQIVKSDGLGPRGGHPPLWEHASPDGRGGWVLREAYPPATTLREAKLAVES